ncbi:HIT family protein [Candidatus Nanohalococcus occultus]|uniref:HIT family hydrolase n=1 Tax=Candidatus Nanohalococcus occultus TaxID=2978047 RepID=A0ABY8CD55_9ARCH|nr:HIT family hydrolase [Candidatus Nanohaloarchaeota archaeon SVXNc]
MTDLKPYEYYLWSPKREEYEANEIPDDINCIFCSQAEDDERISKLEIYEDDFLMVELNIFPYNTGHLMVVPKRHLNSLTELEDEERDRLFSMVAKVEELQREVVDPAGIDVGLNIGEAAGESIQHLHVQLVPIYGHDRGFMETSLDTKVMKKSLPDMQEEYKDNVEILEGYWE